MRKLWIEFKAFALGGNMLDLALGFIMGTAFAAVVQSLAKNLLMQLVAAIFGKPDFSRFSLTLNGAEIRYGAFLTDFLNFLMMAAVLFVMVKLMKKIGLGNFRAQGQMECPFCKEFVSSDALICKWCTAELEPAMVDQEEERRRHSFRRAAPEQV
ncbi:large conductance mechanosensitive channel protein MscL [Microlunatus soli]|uniref:Large conductance mechanosensitive channel n=1 Tax=Microlunatus soli TaxID=630515 RepID=A0A1H1X091_9ACTN|nr:large conductance mechanosensitive channel protein MscL [Microlunatus soli]SDT02733.1 large conductance mechanosensitive channel [Microlunatus soli]